jgi:serine/threonine protein phosphatase PrpC
LTVLRAGSATDVGLVRSNNQDQFLVAPPLYAVADGMGGAAAGEVASAVAVEALGEAFAASDGATPDSLVEAARAANRAVWEEAEANPEMRGMGTTLVALAQVDGDRLAVANVGDSRAYVLHGGELRQVTSDHSLVAEMVAEGRISKEEAEIHPRRNIMTRALGVEPDVPVDLFVEEANPGDRFVLCSDGLPREVSDEVISAVLRRRADPSEAARELVEEAKRRGGNDNITVVVVDVVDTEGSDAEGGMDEPARTQAGPDEPTAMVAAAAPVAPPAPAAPAPPPPGEARAPKSRRTALRHPSPVNLRVAGFVLVLLLVLGAGAAGVVWYARSAYYVGLRGQQIVIYQGRPGGVLWLQPTLAEVTRYTTSDVLSYRVQSLRAGQEEPSLGAARNYIAALVAERQRTQLGAA